jgi:hypothetical protein
VEIHEQIAMFSKLTIAPPKVARGARRPPIANNSPRKNVINRLFSARDLMI